MISEQTGWVRAYRGLWGLYTQDPFAGEDAPAGPMYNRDGSVRRAWFDPVGWAGLDKVSPRAALLDTVEQQKETLRRKEAQLRQEVEEQIAALRQWAQGRARPASRSERMPPICSSSVST